MPWLPWLPCLAAAQHSVCGQERWHVRNIFPIAQSQALFNITGCRRPLKEFEQRFLLEDEELKILAHVEKHFN